MTSFIPGMMSHLRKLVSAAAEIGESSDGPMWPAVLDFRTGRFPTQEHVPKRVYRLIGAPRGSTLYWDQPLVVAAYALSELAGASDLARAADRYVEAFLERCVAGNGMFQWGNHQYYDLFDRKVVSFHGEHHELRPITPAWEVFWQHDPKRTANYVRTMADRHVYDPETGAFNRHDDGKRGHAFLEAGGILAESLAWLHGKTGEAELRDMALRIARYSYGHRVASTGLVQNEPDHGRWDSKVCTSEVGLWAQCLLRAGHYTSNDEFIEMARNATRAYVEHAYDEAAERYFGQVAVDTGKAVIPAETGYWPREHTDAWSTDQWPTHDYPMAVAEACLSLYEVTSEQALLEAVRRWARIAEETRPGRTGGWAYAESYGRCIHLLARAGLQLRDELLFTASSELAAEAADRLCANDMYQGYFGTHVYESVDGVGYLFLALILLETRREPDLLGFGF